MNDFFKICFREGNSVYYYSRSDVSFHMEKKGNELILADEIDKIEVVLPFDKKSELQSLLIKYISKKERQIWQKTIEQLLMDAFKTGEYSRILGKPYLVYDIETTVVDDLKSAKFLLAYAMTPNEQDHTMKYEPIMIENLKEFVERMLAFDGYIVGFNQIWFDNPVSVWNAGYGEKEIAILNEKSIDLYVFFQNLTKKRIGLNKLSETLIGVQKTLESWAQGEVLRNKWIETWEKKYLEEFKKYCKNDVRMTALVMFYFLHFKKLFIDGEEFSYSLEEFVQKSNNTLGENHENTLQNQSIF